MKRDSATVTSKGQIVIPVELRKRLNIRQGTRIRFREEQGCVILEPITADFISSLRGISKGRTSLVAALKRKRGKDWCP